MKTGKIAEYTKKRKTFVERDKGRYGKKRSDKKEKKFRKHIKIAQISHGKSVKYNKNL